MTQLVEEDQQIGYKNTLQEIFMKVKKRAVTGWKDMGFFGKMLFLMESPITVLMYPPLSQPPDGPAGQPPAVLHSAEVPLPFHHAALPLRLQADAR